MRAMVCRAWGAPDVLRPENVPPRALRPGEVRIRVRAAGVNFADSLMVAGTYQVKPPFPFTPGLEAAGEVIETGSRVVTAMPHFLWKATSATPRALAAVRLARLA